MTELTLEVKDDSVLQSIVILLSSVKWVKVIESKDRYNKAERGLINGIQELNAYKRGEIEFWDARELLKTL